MKRILVFTAALAAGAIGFCLRPVQAATYYVNAGAKPGAIAPTGTQTDPFPTIGAAAKIAGAGDTVVIRSGIYRETVETPASGTADKPIVFEAAPGASVVVTGAERLTKWQKEPTGSAVYSTDWPYTFLRPPFYAHPDDPSNAVVGRCEQVFVGGYLLREVLNKSQIGPGMFYVDLAAKRLYAEASNFADLSTGGPEVEASARQRIWQCAGDYVTLQGFQFRYAANMAQTGSVVLTGSHDTVQGCVFEDTNGVGAQFHGTDETAIDCAFRDNGQLGFAAEEADRLHLIGCTIEGNNTKNFSRGWEAGGDKTVLTRDAVFESCRFVRNHGGGVWFDIGNEDCDVHNCLIADNEGAGISNEISYGLHVHDNVIVGNSLYFQVVGEDWSSGGICNSSSPGSVVERNLIVGNREGFDFREQIRTTPRIGEAKGAREEPVWNHDETVRDNILAYNRDAQTWGWFDVWDARNWPPAMQKQMSDQTPSNGPTAAYLAALKGQPDGLTLEKLNLDLGGNVYATSGSQGLFHWGASWRRHIYYDSLDMVRAQLGEEKGSIVAPLDFAAIWAMDFRLPKDSQVFKMDCYPHGDVPGVRLGAIAD